MRMRSQSASVLHLGINLALFDPRMAGASR
jgi:hypothetical protein